MSELSQQPHVTVDGQTVRGDEYCDQIITFLCQIKVATEDIVAFTGILRELEMPLTAVNRYFCFYNFSFLDVFIFCQSGDGKALNLLRDHSLDASIVQTFV